jgi:hypothetical protein
MEEYYDEVTIVGGKINGRPGEILEAERQLFGEEKSGKYRVVRAAGCGHVIHSRNDLGGFCQYKGCGLLTCRTCTSICTRCRTVICPQHTRFHGGYSFCPRCWWIALFFGFGGGGGGGGSLPRENERKGPIHRIHSEVAERPSLSRRICESLFGPLD